MHVHRSLVLLVSTAILLAAAPNWQKILENSGWCKHANGSIGSLDEDPHTYQVKGPSARDIGLGGRANNDWFPVGKLPPTKMPTLPVTVRWDSAQPVREALVATQAADATDTENTLSAPEKYYIIAVIGLAAPEKTNDAEHAHFEETRIRQGLLNESRLMLHDRPPIIPEDARVDQNTGEIRIYFPKDKPITLDEKEVAFGTVFGSVRVLQKFRLKDMVYKGQLAL
jgi:hypothetical protein